MVVLLIFLSHQVSGIQLLPVEVDADGTIYNDYWFMNVLARYPVLKIKKSGTRRYDDDYETDTFLFRRYWIKTS